LFGGGLGTMLASGNLYRNVSGVGITPSTTAADIVVDFFALPANSFDGTSNRGLTITSSGNFANNGNTKTCKLIFNCAAPTINSAVSGGTTIATTGASTSANCGWMLQSQVFKYGAKGSNTQMYQELATVVGTTHGGMGLAAAITATENAIIYIAVTINAATTATDASLWEWEVTGYN
jgi:hypothetical protein